MQEIRSAIIKVINLKLLAKGTRHISKQVGYFAVVFLFFFTATTYIAVSFVTRTTKGKTISVDYDTANKSSRMLRTSFRSNNADLLRMFGVKLQEDREKSDIFLIIKNQDTGLMKEYERGLADIIFDESKRYDRDPIFTLAMIMTESTFYNWSQSRADAHGLMQIKTTTGSIVAKELGVNWEGRQTLFDPFVNIRFGMYYFNKMVDRFKNKDVALVAYNMGPTKVRKLISGRNKLPMRYPRKVNRNYNKLVKNISAL